MSTDKYNKYFGITKFTIRPTDKHIRAFSQVADIRKFEIDMYWKRAAYFWTIIAVTFTGFFALSASSSFPYKDLFLLLLSNMGLVFTFSWYLVNRGSKYWQENWGNHLDHMEDKITGPLYKTILERPKVSNKKNNKIDHFFTGPSKLSVSKINQWVAIYICFIWFFLIMIASSSVFIELKNIMPIPKSYVAMGFIVLSFIAMILMYWKGKTHSGEYLSSLVERHSRIVP